MESLGHSSFSSTALSRQHDEEATSRLRPLHYLAFYKAGGKYATNFDGEVEAIFIALNQLSTRKSNFCRPVILSDSKATSQAISNNKV
ncbi:hypothetical protein TNCV_3819331 [Trichonephila clavipes]|nr:hypothetical protein TNCV_3819331 [Trichonephila clavipes]